MHCDYSSPEAVPAFDPCPRVCIWSHRADRGSIPPRWGDDPGSRAGPARGFAAGRGGRAVVPLRTPQNGSGGVKTGYGGGAPMQARPCSQEAACSRLMAVTQRRSPRALQTYPTTSASGRGEAPSSTAPHDDRRPDRRGPRKYRPHASHAPGTSTPPGARQAPRPRRPPPGARRRRRRPGTAKRIAQH
jgi:hypothetical protein